MKIPKNWLMKAKKIQLVVMVAFLVAFSMAAGLSAKENVVNLPYYVNVPSFVPYYWQQQHILAQGSIFEGLFGYEPDPSALGGVKVVPCIADKWTVSADGKTWTVTLRKDKKWSNGDPINAKDFEWTYKYMCDPNIPDVPLWANQMQHVKNGWTVKAGGAPLDALGVKTTDDYTIVFTLETARFDFNCWLAVAGSMPLHRKTIEKFGADWWKPGNFVGNGPYIPTSLVPNKECVLVKNKNYVGTTGNVDKVVLKFYPDDANEIIAFQAGEIDAAWVRNVSELSFVKKQAALKKVLTETANDLQWQGIQVSRGFNEIMDNKKLRQAFAMSIDRDTLCKTVLAGRSVPAGSVWTQDSILGKKLKPIGYDPAAAKKLLADAGYPNGKGLPVMKFYITGTMPEAEFVADQWKKNLGVTVQIENIDSGVYWGQFVWPQFTKDAGPGFTRINGPMNSFETGALDKNMMHTVFFYDLPTPVRKQMYELEETRINFLTKEGGLTQAEWDVMAAQRDKLIAARKIILANEPSKLYLDEMTRGVPLATQYQELYDKWAAAGTDKEKTDQWRYANRMLLNEERAILEYNGKTEANKQAKRLRLETEIMPFEKAVENASAYIQVLQDQYYMIPLFMDNIQYLKKANISGLGVYKFSWGPAFFNYKFLNVK